jgi:Mg2+-importing ATPase
MHDAGAMSADPFWSPSAEELLNELGSSPRGLDSAVAADRLERIGPNVLRRTAGAGVLALLLRQFTTPIVLILLGAAVLAFLVQDPVDGAIILGIVGISGLLGAWQEHGATDAVERLLELVEQRTQVVRDGEPRMLPVDDLVPGDIVLLEAGSGVPADARILQSRDLFVNEAPLTGETFPVEKQPAELPADTPLARRTNSLFMGTNVVSGTARALIVRTGAHTEFGAISERLRLRPPETEFEHGLRRFGYFLGEVTILLSVAIFGLNVALARPVFDSFLFALALAVGLTPQLLPAIVSVNLARGARRMAAQRVIVKRLAAIENFGSMNVLCADKTGTLTSGEVRVHAMLDVDARPSEAVRRFAYLNSSLHTGFRNPIDEAVTGSPDPPDVTGWGKLDEIPYDFVRRRLSVVAARNGQVWLITKGAFDHVLEVCTTAADGAGGEVPLREREVSLRETYVQLSAQGFRTLGLAIRPLERSTVSREDEAGMRFVGFLVLDDPPKPGIAQTLAELQGLGITLKVITGDNRLVAEQVGQRVGMERPVVLSGRELRDIPDEALPVRASAVDIFAEIEPSQKERIVRALRRAGHVVGFMGDGINDASALHSADVGISVKEAVDVARSAADIVLLESDLAVLADGVRAGRTTFANTIKYVFMATSANFGNMFSMAGASLFLPFLPLLPRQILLTNLLTDLPEMTIATDRVDEDWISRPRRWDVGFIKRFMLVFGLISSVFDYLTFGVLLLVLRASPELFRTGWFVESVVSASMIVLVIRTRGSFVKHRPSWPLLLATLTVVALTVSIPYSPLGALFQFVPLPPLFLAVLGGIVVMYVASAEIAKHFFYRAHEKSRPPERRSVGGWVAGG